MQKINSVTWHKVNLQNNRIAVKVAIINIWLITGISFTFAPAMIDRRERIRSLLSIIAAANVKEIPVISQILIMATLTAILLFCKLTLCHVTLFIFCIPDLSCLQAGVSFHHSYLQNYKTGKETISRNA